MPQQPREDPTMSFRNLRSFFATTLLLVILAACTSEQSTQQKIQPTPTPVVIGSDFHWVPIQEGTQVINAKGFLEKAQFITRDWPGHPDWKYIDVQRNSILFTAHKLQESTQTTIQVPLDPGVYQLTGLALLRYECQFPLVLSGKLLGQSTSPVFRHTFTPINAIPIRETFVVTGTGDSLELKCSMAEGADNSFSSTLTISGFRLRKLKDNKKP